MAWTRAGSRPEEWWEYEKQMPQPCDLGDERITLFEMAELTETELAELMPEWREEYEKANEPNFSYCTGHGWPRGEAAKRAQYRWAGIPRAFIRQVGCRAPPPCQEDSQARGTPGRFRRCCRRESWQTDGLTRRS